MTHKGNLKVDATVADQYIKYPTDLNLLNESRENLERMIDLLYAKVDLKKKPRNYRRKARQEYLLIMKKKRRSFKIIRKEIKAQLQYVRRDLKIVEAMLDINEQEYGRARRPLDKRDQRLYWVIKLVFEQQSFMFENNVRSHPNRIVNLHQPYVPPIVRGKTKGNTEFGAKLSVSECNGMCQVDQIHWEAANEAGDLINQIEIIRSAMVIIQRLY